METTWRRAWKDTRTWLLSSFVAWLLMFIVTVGSGVLVALFLPTNPTPLRQAVYGGVGALIALFAILAVIYLAHLVIITPYRQRDEAIAELTKITQSMAYSLQVVTVVGNYPTHEPGLGIMIRLKNTLGKPLRYQVRSIGAKLDSTPLKLLNF